MRNLSLAVTTLFALLLGVPAAKAADAGVCGGDVAAVANIGGTYDPFSGVGLSQSASVTISRNNGGGGKKTAEISFYFKPTTGFPSPAGLQILHGANNIFDDSDAGTPIPVLNNNSAGTITSAGGSDGYLDIGYGGNGQLDAHSVTLSFVIPGGWDVPAGSTISLDMVYICDGNGGFGDVGAPGATSPTAVSLSVTVPSAMQVSYAGPALAFGEIGDVTNAQAPTHTVSGQFNVRSTSPYSVDLSSGNGFIMRYPSGPTGTPNVGTIPYSLNFLTQTRSNASPTFTQVKCPRVGIGLPAHNLGISATLQEGGDGKTPQSYSDTLTVTFAPLAVPASGVVGSCS